MLIKEDTFYIESNENWNLIPIYNILLSLFIYEPRIILCNIMYFKLLQSELRTKYDVEIRQWRYRFYVQIFVSLIIKIEWDHIYAVS